MSRSGLSGKTYLPGRRVLWQGVGRMRTALSKLLWVSLRLILSGWLWGTAVRLAHFQPPTKTAGAVLAVIAVLLLGWAVWGIWQVVRILGLKRLGILSIIVFSAIVVFNVLTANDDQPTTERLITQASQVVQQLGESLAHAFESVTQAPDEFFFAYTGERALPPSPPGYPTPDPRATPIRIDVRGSGNPSPAAAKPLAVGSYARVVNTDGQSLRARSSPGTRFDIVLRFPAGTRLHILEGPVSSDGFTWWKAQGQQGEGWCADQWLARVE